MCKATRLPSEWNWTLWGYLKAAALPANTRLGWKCPHFANTLAYSSSDFLRRMTPEWTGRQERSASNDSHYVKTFFNRPTRQPTNPHFFVAQILFQRSNTINRLCTVLGPYSKHLTVFVTYESPNKLVFCYWEAFLFWCNVTLQLIAPIRKLRTKWSVVNTDPEVVFMTLYFFVT